MGHRYLQLDVGTARPEVLVSRLFQKAIQCSRAARTEEMTDSLQRLRSLRRSLDIVSELRSTLDIEVAGEMGENLDRLYEFVNHRLMLASVETDDRMIDEALRVLEPLGEAWLELASTPREETA